MVVYPFKTAFMVVYPFNCIEEESEVLSYTSCLKYNAKSLFAHLKLLAHFYIVVKGQKYRS